MLTADDEPHVEHRRKDQDPAARSTSCREAGAASYNRESVASTFVSIWSFATAASAFALGPVVVQAEIPAPAIAIASAITAK